MLWRTIIDRVRQTPNVETASLARVPPGGLEGIGLGGVAPGYQPSTTDMLSPAWNIVDTGYFARRFAFPSSLDGTSRRTIRPAPSPSW